MQEMDQLVGKRIKTRRQALGMTQTELATAIDVRFQQVQKYENGQNRVAASRLWQISQAMNVPVSYFFEDSPETPQPFENTGVAPRKKRELIDLFTALSAPQQTAVLSFLRSVSD
ncbi:helix-turn-helix domain-containing protein [Thalassococcus lentus]|uniref:Helix-turn-helix transcriptional regulator n=1 Tax=Thalassococcus lentus TaxID=1210524 RepID=A0ABT4XRZ2_9RHOB|nr:helix-turn-helix transcriptional regulator [Thalassococcus lentus]MDA7424728.1 helix-turn-helix transcriptional regulator [Thalassococcus lentus]